MSRAALLMGAPASSLERPATILTPAPALGRLHGAEVGVPHPMGRISPDDLVQSFSAVICDTLGYVGRSLSFVFDGGSHPLDASSESDEPSDCDNESVLLRSSDCEETESSDDSDDLTVCKPTFNIEKGTNVTVTKEGCLGENSRVGDNAYIEAHTGPNCVVGTGVRIREPVEANTVVLPDTDVDQSVLPGANRIVYRDRNGVLQSERPIASDEVRRVYDRGDRSFDVSAMEFLVGKDFQVRGNSTECTNFFGKRVDIDGKEMASCKKNQGLLVGRRLLGEVSYPSFNVSARTLWCVLFSGLLFCATQLDPLKEG